MNILGILNTMVSSETESFGFYNQPSNISFLGVLLPNCFFKKMLVQFSISYIYSGKLDSRLHFRGVFWVSFATF